MRRQAPKRESNVDGFGFAKDKWFEQESFFPLFEVTDEATTEAELANMEPGQGHQKRRPRR